MAAKVVQLKDRDGISIFPVTQPEVIIFPNNKNLSYVLSNLDVDVTDTNDIKYLESVENVNDVNPTNVTFNNVVNILSADTTISIFPKINN